LEALIGSIRCQYFPSQDEVWGGYSESAVGVGSTTRRKIPAFPLAFSINRTKIAKRAFFGVGPIFTPG